jgi:hypothetical protein
LEERSLIDFKTPKTSGQKSGYSLIENTRSGKLNFLRNATLHEAVHMVGHLCQYVIYRRDSEYVLSLPDGSELKGNDIVDWLDRHTNYDHTQQKGKST